MPRMRLSAWLASRLHISFEMNYLSALCCVLKRVHAEILSASVLRFVTEGIEGHFASSARFHCRLAEFSDLEGLRLRVELCNRDIEELSIGESSKMKLGELEQFRRPTGAAAEV